MTTQELEQVILEYIRDIYKKEYIGKIKIEHLNPGYCVKLGMNTPETPIVIYGELEDKQFLKFLKNDLKSRNFHFSHYGCLKSDYPIDCNPISTVCGCNDKTRINR